MFMFFVLVTFPSSLYIICLLALQMSPLALSAAKTSVLCPRGPRV